MFSEFDLRTDTGKEFHSGMVWEKKEYLSQFLFGRRFWYVSGKDRHVWVLSSCHGVFLMSMSTSLLIILYIKVNRDAALRSSKVFHPESLNMIATLDSLLQSLVTNLAALL